MGERTGGAMVSQDIAVALSRLAPSWAGYWPGHDVAAEAAAVRSRFEEAVRAWGVRDVGVVPWGDVALVVTGSREGAGVVVKVSPRGWCGDAELAGEASALDAWQTSRAAVHLLDRRDDGATLLLERLLPGTMLDETGIGVTERLVLLGSLARRLHALGPPTADLQPMSAFARPWRRTLAGTPDSLTELDVLCAPADDDVVVHLDLHGRNVLRDGDRWVVIDPKGVRGDRHADVWALIDPSVPALPSGAGAARRAARERVALYATTAGMDPDRAAAWARLRARAGALAFDAAPTVSSDDVAWAVRLRAMADALG